MAAAVAVVVPIPAGPLLGAMALGLHAAGIWLIAGLLAIALASFALFIQATSGQGGAGAMLPEMHREEQGERTK